MPQVYLVLSLGNSLHLQVYSEKLFLWALGFFYPNKGNTFLLLSQKWVFHFVEIKSKLIIPDLRILGSDQLLLHWNQAKKTLLSEHPKLLQVVVEFWKIRSLAENSRSLQSPHEGQVHVASIQLYVKLFADLAQHLDPVLVVEEEFFLELFILPLFFGEPKKNQVWIELEFCLGELKLWVVVRRFSDCVYLSVDYYFLSRLVGAIVCERHSLVLANKSVSVSVVCLTQICNSVLNVSH